MLTKALNSDEEHLVPEAVQTFQAKSSVYDKEKLRRKPDAVVTEKREATPPAEVVTEEVITKKIDLPIDKGLPMDKNIPKRTSNDHVSEPDKKSAAGGVEIGSSTIFIRTVTGPSPTAEPPRSRLGIMKSKFRDDERRHTSPVSIHDITRAKEEFLKCGNGDMKKRSASPVKKDALFRTLQSIEQLQRVLESPPPPTPARQNFGSSDALDRLHCSARSTSPEKKPSAVFASRFRPSPLTVGVSFTTGSRGYILSKTASASCVPSRKITFPLSSDELPTDSLTKVLSVSNVPSENKLEAMDETNFCALSSPLSPKITLEPVFEDPTLNLEQTDYKNVTSEPVPVIKDTLPDQLHLLSPTRKNKDDIMLDSESMSSASTLNEDDVVSYKCATKMAPIDGQGTKNAGLKSDDLDTDDLSGSDWANDDLASVCDEDMDFGGGLRRFVTTRDKSRVVRKLSWEDESDCGDDIFSEPSRPIADTFHAAFIQSISEDLTPVVADAKFIESDDDLTPVAESKQSMLRMKSACKSLELLKSDGRPSIESDVSDESLYQTPPGTRYKGYTGNFAQKISPFGSILDSVLRRKSESSRNVMSVPVESKQPEKCDRKSLKLKLLDFDQLNGGEKRIVRRRSIHGDTPKTFADEDAFFTPATSRKKCPDQRRPWSVYGTPTETRKVLPSFESAPGKDATDFRLLTTVERDKLRNEARRRARLKSDEELGLSPSYYRRKYSSRTDSVPETTNRLDVSDSAEQFPGDINSTDGPEANFETAANTSDSANYIQNVFMIEKSSASGGITKDGSKPNDPIQDRLNGSEGEVSSIDVKTSTPTPLRPEKCIGDSQDDPGTVVSSLDVKASIPVDSELEKQSQNGSGSELSSVNTKTSTQVTVRADQDVSQTVSSSADVKSSAPAPSKPEISQSDLKNESSSAVDTNSPIVVPRPEDCVDVKSSSAPEIVSKAIAMQPQDSAIQVETSSSSAVDTSQYNAKAEFLFCNSSKSAEAPFKARAAADKGAPKIINNKEKLPDPNTSSKKLDPNRRHQDSKEISSSSSLDKGSSSEDILSKPIGDSLVDSSSRDSTLDVDGTSGHCDTLERESRKKAKKKKEAADDDGKPAKRKSFFSMLSLAKSPENVKKHEKTKDSSSSNTSGECKSNPTTPVKSGKERGFLRLRLSRSKEKFREKKKECDRGEALVPAVDDVPTPVTTVYATDIVVLPANKAADLVKGNSPPQASGRRFFICSSCTKINMDPSTTMYPEP